VWHSMPRHRHTVTARWTRGTHSEAPVVRGTDEVVAGRVEGDAVHAAVVRRVVLHTNVGHARH
jgi:hypothetical protein